MTEKKYEIYDLESEIMSVWNTKDDLESITSRMMDDPDGPLTEDEIANVLIGLTELHDIRCKKLFNVFESMIKEKRFNEVEKLTPGLVL
jgi:hypothetical protein